MTSNYLRPLSSRIKVPRSSFTPRLVLPQRTQATATCSTLRPPSIPSIPQAREHQSSTGSTSLESLTSGGTSTTPKSTFYRRPLPPNLVSFTSPEGKLLFKESLMMGYAENYFSLVGNFTHQSEPAYCGISSLAMVLNALEIDPRKRWKGGWRWYSDEMLECCAPLDVIRQKGITFREFSCLAKCNGLRVTAKQGDQVTFEEFVQDLQQCTSSSAPESHMVVSFSRKTLKQTGDGHFSPISCYHPKRDLVLVLDTARFKYPCYFVNVRELYDAMKPVDKETGLPRGYFLLSKGGSDNQFNRSSITGIPLCNVSNGSYSWSKLAKHFCQDIPKRLSLHSITSPQNLPNSDLHLTIESLLSSIPQSFIISFTPIPIDLTQSSPTTHSHNTIQHIDHLRQLSCDIQSHPIFSTVEKLLSNPANPKINSLRSTLSQSSKSFLSSLPSPHLSSINASTLPSILATILLFSLPRDLYVRSIPSVVAEKLDGNRVIGLSRISRTEITRIKDVIETLLNEFCECRLSKKISNGKDGSNKVLEISVPCENQRY